MCSTACDLSTLSACRWHLLEPSPDPCRDQRLQGRGQDTDCHGPRCRHRHSAVCVGHYVYIFGGKEGMSPRKDVWRFCIDSRTWEAVELRGVCLPFLQGHTTVLHQNQVLIFGGTFSDSMGDVQLWTFDLDKGGVSEVRLKAGACQPSCRRDHSAVIHRSIMYVFGGFVGSTGANRQMWTFNIETMEWWEVQALNNIWPAGRYSHTAVVADNAMWMFGGLAGLQPRADLWRFSFLLHQWKKVKALGSPPTLSGHTASVVQRHMVVIGGKSQGRAVNEVWCFSFDTSTWQQLYQLDTVLPCLTFHTCVTFPLPTQSPDEHTTRSSPDHTDQHISSNDSVQHVSSSHTVQHVNSSPSLKGGASHAKIGMSGSSSSPQISDRKAGKSAQTAQQLKMSAKLEVDETVPFHRPANFKQETVPFYHPVDFKQETVPFHRPADFKQETVPFQHYTQTHHGENSGDITDSRVHVSSKESLICPDSPEADILSNRSHFVRKTSAYVQLMEEYGHDITDSGPHSSKLTQSSSISSSGPTLHHMSPVCVSKNCAPNLIDLSGSLMQKVPSLKQDLFSEELDLLRHAGHSRASTLGTLERASAGQQNQTGRSDTQKAVSGFQIEAMQPAHSAPFLGAPHTVDFTICYQPDLQHLLSGQEILTPVCTPTEELLYTHSLSQPAEDSVAAEGFKTSEDRDGGDLVDQKLCKQQHKVCFPAELFGQQGVCSSLPSATKEFQECCASTPCGADWCDTDSWIDSGEDAILTAEDVCLISAEQELGADSKMRPVPRSRDSALRGAASGKKVRKIREDIQGKRERGKAMCAWREAELGRECLLVMGGHWDGQGTGMAQPMAVWTGSVL